ncbi:MAG TPA: hypothetical protein VEC10_05910 [Steroidobacteraceae bacterium]|nr:hypothetical protein [Steroidobacteraceae bacterium]
MRRFAIMTDWTAVTVLAAASSMSFAQQSTVTTTPDRSPAGSPPAQEPPGSAASDQEGIEAPVLQITSVEVIRTAHAPVLDIIRVRGLASSSGWEEAELLPLTRGKPADGMLHLMFVARAPAEAMEANGFETVEAIFPLETDHPFKGVNVHSATDSVTVSSIPGYSEGKAAGDDCHKCVGKVFVARGSAAPSGKPASELVKEEQLPPIKRVIGPADGIPTADSNPNRLTLILNREGRIVTAVWE